MCSRITIDFHRSPVASLFIALSDSVSPIQSCKKVMQHCLARSCNCISVSLGRCLTWALAPFVTALHPLPARHWNLTLPRYFESQPKSSLCAICVSWSQHCPVWHVQIHPITTARLSVNFKHRHLDENITGSVWCDPSNGCEVLCWFLMYSTWSFQAVACLAICWHNGSKIFKVSESHWHFRPKLWQAEEFKFGKKPSICGLLHFGGTSFESISTLNLDTIIICHTGSFMSFCNRLLMSLLNP